MNMGNVTHENQEITRRFESCLIERASLKFLSVSVFMGDFMPILFILTLIAQIFCAVHVVRTGREKYWIGLIIMVPGIGCLVYFLTQILPELGQSRTATKALDGAVKILDPNREFREAKNELEKVESVQNRIRLIDAAMALENFDVAEHQLSIAMQGYYEHDPHMLMRLAEIKLKQNEPSYTIGLLDRLQKHNKDFHSQAGHLLYATAHEKAGNIDTALDAYESLTAYATGEEARIRYGLLLQHTGHINEAKTVFLETLRRIKHGNKFYRKSEREWGNIARDQLNKTTS